MNARNPLHQLTLGLLLVLAALAAGTARANPNEILAAYVAKAGAAASPERGQAFFTQKRKGNLFESCADCHTAMPTARGRDQASEKTIPPLAPAANPKRFTDASRVENLFQVNCKDVVGRACTAQEKADVISWLISLKP
jgi:hypothetical protein